MARAVIVYHQRRHDRQHARRLDTSATTKAKAEAGQVPCPACLRFVAVRADGMLRTHQAPDGLPCPNHSPEGQVHVEVVPEIAVGRAARRNQRTDTIRGEVYPARPVSEYGGQAKVHAAIGDVSLCNRPVGERVDVSIEQVTCRLCRGTRAFRRLLEDNGGHDTSPTGG